MGKYHREAVAFRAVVEDHDLQRVVVVVEADPLEDEGGAPLSISSAAARYGDAPAA